MRTSVEIREVRLEDRKFLGLWSLRSVETGQGGGEYAVGASGSFRVSSYQSWNYVLVGLSEKK
jgi:hypothetical protein